MRTFAARIGPHAIDTRKSMFIAAVLLVLPLRLSAHHSFAAEYDANKRVVVTGTVSGFTWTNPHAWLSVDATDDAGTPVTWRFEMGSPNGLLHRGWRRVELKKGDFVTVEGFAAKDASHLANAGTVTLPDGRKLFGGFKSTPGAPAKARRHGA